MSVSCCYRCPLRTVTCHVTCKRYKDEKADRDKKKKERESEESIRKYMGQRKMKITCYLIKHKQRRQRIKR